MMTETTTPVGTPAPAAATTTAPATEATPAATPAATPEPTTSAATSETEGPRNARELIESMRRGDRSTEASHHSATQPRDPVGRFAPGEAGDDGGPTGTPDGAAADPAAAPSTGTETPAANAPPAGFVRIPLSVGHPLRDQGLDHIDAPASQERAIRSLLNTPVRRAELDALRRETRTLRAQLLDEQARARALNDTYDATLSDPEAARRLAEIREVYGDEAAETFKRGMQDEVAARTVEHRKTLDDQQQAEHLEQAGRHFAVETESQVLSRFPEWWTGQPGFRSLVNEVIHAYGNDLAAKEALGRPADADPADVVRMLEYRFVNDPAVRQRAQVTLAQKKADADARAAAAAATQAAQANDERDRLAMEQAARASARNPFGRVAAGINHSQSGGIPAAETTRDFVRRTLSGR